MSDRRPFPPSPRRLALARASGLTAASPLLVGAAAMVAACATLWALGRAAAARLGAWITSAASAAEPSSPVRALDMFLATTLELALPLLAAIAIAALVTHVAQTRALWLPRRRIPGAPSLPRREVSRSLLDMANAATIGLVTLGWLWWTAPQLARLGEAPLQAGAAIASLLVALAVVWVALGVVDALVRRSRLASALAMSREDKREDDRLTAADPRWRDQRLVAQRGSSSRDAVARAALVLVGDDVAVAIDWDARRQPVPLRSATGRRARATQLVGLARRHGVAVHRDAVLAAALVTGEGPVPDVHWARLAEIIAAIRGAREPAPGP